MILFLDFDGVTHPECADSDQLFCCTGQLWKILRACPDVQVVFSTSWREIHRPDEMLDFVTYGGGEDLAHRFIGSTPSVLKEPGALVTGRIYKREDECQEWLRNNGGVDQPWLALDDIDYWFREPNLYLVNHLSGLTDADVLAIIERIQREKPQPTAVLESDWGKRIIANMDRMAVDEEYRNSIAKDLS